MRESSSGSVRWIAMRWLVIACVVACSRDGAPTDRPAVVARDKAAPPRPAQLTHVTIKALGMYCEESCPMKVRYALADDPHVYELGFDVSNESIFVSYDSTLGTPKDVTKSMIAAIKTKAGFDPWLAKESWPDDAADKVQVVWR